jgi:hypothetical protein
MCGIIFKRALPENAPNHAALCDREVGAHHEADVSEWFCLTEDWVLPKNPFRCLKAFWGNRPKKKDI